MGKSSKRKREVTEEPQEEEGYQVEVITHAHVKNLAWEYRVKWAGYGSDEDSWEPAENLAGCQRLVESFWTEIGLDNEDYVEGYTVEPSKRWIRKEQKRFKEEFTANKEEERKQKERAERKKEEALAAKKAAKKRKQSLEMPSRSASTSSVRLNPRTSSSANPSASISAPPKKKPKLFVPDSEGSEDDKPLAKPSASTSAPPKKKPKLFIPDSEGSQDEKPLAKPSASTSASPKKKAKPLVLDSEDSEDDKPLAKLKQKRPRSPKPGDDKQAKVRKTQDKTSASASSSAKLKNFDPSKNEKTSASSSRVPSPPATAKDLDTGKKSAPPSRAPTPTQDKDVESSKNAKKSSPPPPTSETNNKGKASTSRPPTPPAALLFGSSPSPPTSPEIALKSQPRPKPKPKPKVTGKSPADSSTQVQSKVRPQVSINTQLPAPSSPTIPSASKAAPLPLSKVSINPQLPAASSPTIPSVPKATPLPLPKPSAGPLPPPRRTVGHTPASAASSPTVLSRPFATPTLPSATPASAAKPPTPVIPPAKPATPTIPTAKPLPPPPKASGSSRAQPLPPPPSSSSGSGLSTKQRLAQGALDLAPIQREAPKKVGLSGLTFKKTPGPASTAPAASGSNPRARPPAPLPKPPPPRAEIDPLFDDPADIEVPQPESPVEMLSPTDGPSILPPALSRRRPQPSLGTQADDFLQDMMPAKLAAPLTPALDDGPIPNHPPRQGFKPKMLPSRPIPRKWKWSGKLLMTVTDDKDQPPKTDHLCDVVLNELFPPTVEGPQINIVMTSAESLHLLSFHDLVDMSEFLKTSGVRMSSPVPLQQLARLGPSADKDAEPLKILARYMTKKNFVSLVPTFLDGDLVGHLLLFPPVMKVLERMLKVPDEMLKSSSLVVALLPWKPFPEESRRPFSLLAPPTKPPAPSEADWKKTMTNSKYQLALRILKFPSDLHSWFSRTSRTYCIWPPSEERRGNRDRETGYLMSILKECGAKKVGLKKDMRSIFVHVGSLRSLRKFPLLAERRSQMCGIRFYTFGTHETVHPEHWGVREIYPLGGVVTFTARALYEDPWGVVNRIKVINKHPLWTCYILPSVLGLAIKLCSPEEDPLAAFDRDEFVFDRLFRAIDDGEVSVLRAPPLDRNPTATNDPAADWLRDYWIDRPQGSRRMLEFCLSAFSARYSNVPPAEWVSASEGEVSQDLDAMQMQFDIMKQYRRYVIIRAETDNHLDADRDGFEWLTNSSFSFCDDFVSGSQKFTF